MRKNFLKYLGRFVIIVVIIILSFLAGNVISFLTYESLHQAATIPKAPGVFTQWAYDKMVFYSITGALVGVITALCLLYCRESALRYFVRNKHFLRHAVVTLVVQAIVIAGGAVYISFFIDGFIYNFFFLRHLGQLALLLLAQILFISLFLFILPRPKKQNFVF